MAKTTTLLVLALSLLLRVFSVVAQPNNSPSQDGSGDDGESSPQGGVNAGASGSDSGFVHMSKGVEIAIIVVAVLVGGGGSEFYPDSFGAN
jgi:hypothetical protein